MVKISIVMPIFNNEDSLDRSIKSIKNQSLKDIELICVNDGSTDNTESILAYYAKKYNWVKVHTQENQGSGKARNEGMLMASGEYIAFLDADDFFIDKNSLKKLYDVAKNNDANMVSGNIKIVDGEYNFSPFYGIDYYTEDSIIQPEEYGIPWAFYKSIYKRDFLLDNEIFFPDLIRGQDPVFLAEILSKLDVIYTVNIDFYAYYHIDGTNKCDTFKKCYHYITHYKEVFKYFADPKFADLKNQVKQKLFIFMGMMGAEGAEDTLFCIRELFSDDKILVSECEEYYHDKFLNDRNMLEKLSLWNPPKISVIIPVYNVEKYLRECLDTVVNQSLRDIEIICVNDGSTDNSLKILNEYAKEDNRIKIITQKNCGLGCARNSGLLVATGEYIFFLDSDDYISLNTCELLYNNAISNNSDAVLFKVVRFNESELIYSNPIFPLDEYFGDVDFDNFVFNYTSLKQYVMNNSFSAWSKLYKREFLNSYDDFKFPVGIAYEDVLYNVKLFLRASRLSFVPEFFYYYRISNKDSIMHKSSNMFDIFEICNSVERFLKDFDYYDEFSNEFIKFKIKQLSQYIIPSESDEYYNLVVNEFRDMNLNVENIPDNFSKLYKNVLNSSSYENYKSNINNPSINDCNISQNTTKKIKVSVIIPVYNVENYLNECIDSIINQTLTDIEIICINDGSTDNSLKILQEYELVDDRIRIINQENKGLAATRNVGLINSTGDYIYFMDSDDYLEITALEELYTIASDNSLDMVIFKLINFYDETREKFQSDYYDMKFLKDLVGNNIFDYNDVKDNIFFMAVSAPGKLFKKELISELRFPENLIFEDNPFFIEAIFKAKKVYFHDKYLYYRRIRNNSITTSQLSKFQDSIIISNMIFKIVKDLGHFDEFADVLYYRKINSTISRYKSVGDEYKPEFFEKLNADFTSNQSNYEKDSGFNNLNPELKSAFYSCISSDSYKEFDLLMESFGLKRELNNLKVSNDGLNQKLLDSQQFNQNLQSEIINLRVSNDGLNQKLLDSQQFNQNLQSEIKNINLKRAKLEESNKILKNNNKRLSIENANLKSRKNYKIIVKYDKIKDKFYKS